MMNGAKAIVKKYNEVSLILRIVVGLVIGAVLALAVPGAGWVSKIHSKRRGLQSWRLRCRVQAGSASWAACSSAH